MRSARGRARGQRLDRGDAGQAAPGHERVDLVRPLVRVVRLGVAKGLGDAEVGDDAVAAEELAPERDDLRAREAGGGRVSGRRLNYEH